jgi:uncharacterized protein
MRIWLDQVKDDPLEWEETVTVTPDEMARPEVTALGLIDCRGRLTYVEPSFLLSGRMFYDQTMTCDRCLQSFTDRQEPSFELVLSHERETGGGEHQLGEGDFGVWPIEGDIFESTPVWLEQVELNIPMKPLCRPDCKGLCPQCGADLNAGECGCREPLADPRWAALAALKDRLPSA